MTADALSAIFDGRHCNAGSEEWGHSYMGRAGQKSAYEVLPMCIEQHLVRVRGTRPSRSGLRRRRFPHRRGRDTQLRVLRFAEGDKFLTQFIHHGRTFPQI